MRKEPSTSTLVPARDVRIRILGAFAIWSDGAFTHLPAPAQRLAALLAMRGEPTARGIAAGTLWPEVNHDHALANLRTALWRLRRASPGLVHLTQAHLHLDALAAVDLHRSRSLAERILRGELPMREAHGSAVDLSADLLPDLDDEWLVFERERFRDLRSMRSSVSVSSSARSASTPTPSSAGSWRSRASRCGSRPIAR